MSQLRSISRLTIINIGNALLGMATTVAMAWLFGTSERMENYFAASLLLTVVQKLFLVGQFLEVFLPEYVQRREVDGTVKADRCFSALYNHLIMMVVGTALLAFVVMPWCGNLIAPGYSAERQVQVVHMAQVLLAVMCLVVANGHLQIIGNARGWYGRFEFYGLLGSLFGLIGLVVTGKVLGIWAMLVSQGITQVVLLIGSWSYLYRQGYRHAWVWTEPGFSVWKVVGRVGISSIYVIATQFYVMSFISSLTLLPAGTLAVYRYAENLYLRVSGLFMRPIGVVFFTDAATLAHRNPMQLRIRIQEALYQYGLMYFGVLVILFPALPNLLGALWGSPKYHLDDMQQTTFFVWCFFSLLIVEGAGGLYRRLNIIFGDLRVIYLAMTVVQFALGVAAPFIVRSGTVWGAASVLILNVIMLAGAGVVIVLWRRPQFLMFFPLRTWKLVAAAIPSLIFAWAATHWWPWLKYAGDYSMRGKILEVIKACLVGSIGLTLALMSAWIFRVEELSQGWQRLRAGMTKARALLRVS